MGYYIVKNDPRIHNALQIDIKKEDMEVLKEGSIDCDLGENRYIVDYIMERRLFSTYHLFSNDLKELLEIYDEELQFNPIFLCDLKNMKQLVFWKCDFCLFDCIVAGRYKNLEDIVLKKDLGENNFLFKIAFEKQEYLVFDLVLVENILRKEMKGLQFIEIKNYDC